MPLIESNNLLNRFDELLGACTHVDIAVAWAGPGLAVEKLLEHARQTCIRIAVGLSGNATEPATLLRLMEVENVELRVAPAPRGGMFHPKFYRFRGPKQTVCWIGSANFTRGGFGGNAELIHEFGDRKDMGGHWFEGLWQDLDEDPEPAIADYEERYRPPRPGRYKKSGPQSARVALPRLHDVTRWDEFVDALRVLNEYCHRQQFKWDVLGKTCSYLHTIAVGREIARRGSWKNFSRRDRNVLLGLGHWDDRSAWGLLGNLRGAGAVVGAFTPPGNPKHRAHVLEQIHNVVAEEGDIIEAAELAVAAIRQLERFGPAVATRFLALACPNRLVSVNGPSSAVLGRYAGMEQDEDYLADNYGALLQALHQTEWFNAPEPVDPQEREIWHCRTALVDAFVYIPIPKPKRRPSSKLVYR